MKKYVWKVLILSVGGLLLLWSLSEKSRNIPPEHQNESIPGVSVIKVIPAQSSLSVKVSGITMARWPLLMKSAVSGRVISIGGKTSPGDHLEEKQTLLKISPVSYQVAVDDARTKVAKAQFELMNYRHKQYVAEKISRGNKLSSFGRFEPHISMAKSELTSARTELAYAQEMLEQTTVKAPYPAIMVKKMVVPGQWVDAGESMFQIVSSESVDVRVELSRGDWQRLKRVLSVGCSAKVTAFPGTRWDASIRYISPVFDEKTRQRSLVLNVKHPFVGNDPLLPDQFVEVLFSVPLLRDVVEAPSSVLTQDGQVWSLVEGRLKLERIELIEETPGKVRFRYKQKPDQPRLLVRFPLSSMLQGQKALPEKTE
ncbi:efflux RND transporter periplasmic adaptor subunit [Vibrio salinus]|uniref:efflux RND transporter periplasmic adaptor subunit n=1 Tax=Vibrio salinus TaxID=2899784 RepID=UPI001E446754|nr:HlyD family efflux transporter periplasmic adaptor subunit [Vibrio salinus]MCE0494485.1 HlyD family efflux transporter periplasmic adaptor subunit [Vibrio salinus]